MAEYRLKLRDDEVAHYHEQGFLVPDFKLDDDTLSALRECYDQLLAINPDIPSDLMLGPHMTTPGAQGVVGSDRWMQFAEHPVLLDIAEQLVGEDLILWGTTIFGKPARCGKETPWHQDGDYYPIRPLETLTIWIAIDDTTVENGCMRYIPGSHKARKIFSHHWEENDQLVINKVCDEEHYDENQAFDLELQAGQVSFHDVYMIHGSGANNTDRRRAALIIRLMPGSCHYDHHLGDELAEPHQAHDYGNRPLFLLRGADRTGKNDFNIGH
tara:strand:+ start:156 stop:965 length:810 start_codon:yes stop_codon:yes gene_type:complete